MVYEDKPAYGLVVKLIIGLIPGAILAGSLYAWLSGDESAALGLLAEAFVIGLVFWLIFPRQYQIYEDHIRIVLGGPFSVKIGFDNIKAVRVSSRLSFGVNFATAITRSHVDIMRVKGMRIAITPEAQDLFVKNAERALSLWKKTRGNVVEIKSRL